MTKVARSQTIKTVCLAAIILTALAACYAFRVQKRAINQHLNQQLADAVEREDVAAVRSLLSRGADPNAKLVLEAFHVGNKAHSMPIPMEAPPTDAEIEIARLLVRAGLQPFTPDGHVEPFGNPSWLFNFAALGDLDLMRTMMQRARKVSPTLIDDRAILWSAVAKHQLPMLKFLLASGLKPDGRSAVSEVPPPLGLAATYGWVEAVDLLLRSGANPNAQDRDGGEYPLLLAATKGNAGHLEIMKQLMARGATASLQTDSGQTALFFAGEPAAVLLLDHGADVNHRDHFGSTKLMLTVGSGPVSLVKLLLAHGADTTVRVSTAKGEISLEEFAIRMHHPEIASLLKSKSESKQTEPSKQGEHR